jgi:putative peptidoglycan lipid II flippase
VLRSAGLVSLGTLTSRVLGLLRDATIAHALGAGAAADAFVVAFRIPNLFRELLGEGALTSAFLPAYARLRAAGRADEARRLLSTVATLVVATLALLSAAAVALFLLLPPAAVAPGDPGKAALVLDLAAWCFPYAILVCGAAVLAAALQAERRFGIPAFAPAAMNLAWIAGTVLLQPLFADSVEGRARAVAASVLVGGAVQAAVLLPALRRLDLLPRPSFRVRDPELRGLLRALLPAILGLAPVQVNLLVNALLAEALVPGDGANSALYYSSRLVQLPLSLVGVSLAVAAFPAFSRLAAEGRRGDLGGAAARALRACLLLGVPAATGLAVLAVPVAEALFLRGRFDAAAAEAAAGALRFALVGLPAFCALPVATRLFHSLGDTRTPVRAGAWCVALSFAGNLLLVGPLGERGLALSTALAAWANLAALLVLARRRHRVRGLRSLGPAALRAIGGGAAAAAGALGGAAAVRALLGDGAPAAALAAAGVLAGAAAFAAAALALRDPEGRDLLAALARRRE